MIRIVVAGTSPFGIPSFQELLRAKEIKVLGAISQPARPVGRHQKLTPSAVAEWAGLKKLPLLTPKNWQDEPALATLKSWQPDVIVVAAYGVIVPPNFLAIPRIGCLNIHASLLPAYRGASPIAAAIFHGDQKTGITFMRMDVGLDTGPIITQYPVDISPTDTTPTLADKLSAVASKHIVATVIDWCGRKLHEQSQPETASYAKKIRREDGRADWSSAEQLERLLRAYTPWPGVWTTWRGKTIKFLDGQRGSATSNEAPGTVIGLPGGRWGLVCGDGVFVPTIVQFEGKRPQSADQVPGGYPDWVGSQLGV